MKTVPAAKYPALSLVRVVEVSVMLPGARTFVILNVNVFLPTETVTTPSLTEYVPSPTKTGAYFEAYSPSSNSPEDEETYTLPSSENANDVVAEYASFS